MARTYWLVIAGLLAFASSAPAAPSAITIVADQWCPYNCAEDGENPGYIVEIARELFKQEGITVNYKIVPWADAIAKTRAGEYNAIISATYNDAPDFVFPETPQGISTFICWVPKDSTWRYTGPQSLDNVRIGMISDVAYGKVVDAYLARHKDEFGKRITVTRADNASEQNIEGLVAGKFDVIIEDGNVVSYYFAARGVPKAIKAAGSPIDMEHVKDLYLYLAFGPNDPQSKHYAVLVSKGMVRLRESGGLKEILNKYGVDEFYRYVGEPRDGTNPFTTYPDGDKKTQGTDD